MPKKKPAAKAKPAPPVPSDDDIGQFAADRWTIEGTAVVITPPAGEQDEDPAQPTPAGSFPTETNSSGQTGQDSGQNTLETAATPPEATQLAAEDSRKETGDDRNSAAGPGSVPGPELLPEASRARKPGEKKHEYWERMRKAARLAGLARGQGPGTAYVWATEQTDREFPPPEPVIVEELPAEEPPEVLPTIGTSSEPASVAVVPAPPADDQGVSGLSSLPPSWPELPANAQLQIEIAWVTANRLRVRSGTGVDLSKALSPAPSYSALSWLETSILFPAKFADISVKATADNDSEKEFIRREKLAIDEIRSILGEMLEAGDV